MFSIAIPTAQEGAPANATERYVPGLLGFPSPLTDDVPPLCTAAVVIVLSCRVSVPRGSGPVIFRWRRATPPFHPGGRDWGVATQRLVRSLLPPIGCAQCVL